MQLARRFGRARRSPSGSLVGRRRPELANKCPSAAPFALLALSATRKWKVARGNCIRGSGGNKCLLWPLPSLAPSACWPSVVRALNRRRSTSRQVNLTREREREAHGHELARSRALRRSASLSHGRARTGRAHNATVGRFEPANCWRLNYARRSLAWPNDQLAGRLAGWQADWQARRRR